MSKKLVNKLGRNASNSQVIIERSESDNDTTSSNSETSISDSNSNSGTESTESDSDHRETSNLKAGSKSAIKISDNNNKEELYKKVRDEIKNLNPEQRL